MAGHLKTRDGLARRLLGQDAWATRVLLERCRELTPAQFSQQFDVGPGSLHDTLAHVVTAVRRWTDRIGDRPLRPFPVDDGHTWTPDALLELLSECVPDIEAVVSTVIDEGRLDETMEFYAEGRPEPYVFTRGTAIVHLVTHGVHHRAQALNMLRRLGLDDLPDLDAVEWELASHEPG